MATTFKKSKGNAGLEGVQFQLDLVTVFSLNALRNCSDWKISSENEQAGKYDDIVLELPDKNVFLQAKHKQNKKITRDQLFSSNSKNADFSLPKYFFSYLEIKSEVKETTVMVCTNTDINEKGLEGSLNSHHVPSDSLLHYGGTTCPYFTFNENILPYLRESAESYLEKNLQSKGFDTMLITDENMANFLRNFQFFYNYPSGEELHKVIERLLHRLGDLWSRITYHEMYRKVEEWFKQPKGEYLTTSRANAMLCEIRSEQYCNSLKNYNVSFESNNFDLSNSNRIVQVETDGGHLLPMLRIFQALQGGKAKQLYLNPDDDIEMHRHMVEAFGHPRYVFLIMVWSASRDDNTKLSMSSKIREILEKNRYKKVVLLIEDDVDVAQLIRLEDIFNVEESVTFLDFSKNSRDWLLKNKNIVFQGEKVSLEELLETQMAENYIESLDSGMLEMLVRGDKIKVGARVLNLDEDVAQFYVHRTFEKDASDEGNTKSVIPEENLFQVTEKIVLISDCAGMGKSTTLTKMAVQVKQDNSRMWVIKMNLIDYTRILKDSLEKGKETVTVEELMNSQETTKIKNRFEELVFQANRKIVLLLDSVDEIAPNYTSLILDLLRQCQEATNIAKVLATTRPHMTEELRAVLQDVEFFKMIPFTRDHQIEFLINYWTHNLQLEDVNERSKCALYAEILINKMSSWTNLDLYCAEVSLSAMPLQTRMIADIFQEKSQSPDWESCKEFLRGISREPELPEEFDIAKLYDMFIDKKRDIFLDKGNPSGNTAADQALVNQFEECLAYHHALALRAILTEDDCNLFSNYWEDDCGLVLKIGIVQRNEDDLFFIHRTFAEYFIAASILQELQLNSSLEFQQFLIDRVLIDYEYIVIRNFLDNCLQNIVDFISPNVFAKYQSHTCDINFYLVFKLVDEGCLAILRLILKSVRFRIIRGKMISIKDRQTNSGQLTMNTLNYFQIITREAGFNIKDLAGATLLHRAADCCRLNMVKFLIRHGADINIGDIFDDTPLLVAAKTGDLRIIKCLVKHGANVNHRNYEGITALHLAAKRGLIKVVKYLVECGANVNDRSNDGRTALHSAASKGILNVVEYLVEECGVNVNDISGGGRTALHLAALERKLNIVAYLLERGANIDDRSCGGLNALHLAVNGGALDVVKYIIEHGANVNDRCNDGRTAFHMVERGQLLDIMKFLLACGSNVNDKSNTGRTALHKAALRGQLDAIRFIVENGGNVNDRNNEGWSALHCAAKNGKLEAIKYVVECGGNVNDRSSNGCTALHWAFETARLDTIKYIVEQGADINDRDGDGRTALHWAVVTAQLDVIEYLVECGANIFDRSSDGGTALHWATRRGRLPVIKYIVELGADVNDGDGGGYTALHWASEKSRLHVIKYIVERGANINHRNRNGLTALHCAAWGGELDPIKYVVECGGNVTDRDDANRTALHWAAKRGDLDAIKYIEECGANPNDRDVNGRTVLHWAVEGGGLDAIKYFVECGASVNDRDCDGRTALHWAAAGGKTNVIGYLIECGARVNDRSGDDRTALHWAVEECEVMAFEYLVQCGADVNERDSNGRTAAELAREMDLKYAEDFEALSEGADNIDDNGC